MRIAITGASGNVGSALVHTLSTHGDHEVVGVVRRPPSGSERFAGVEWHALDLTRAGCEPGLAAAFAGCDAVVHLAWGFQPTHREDYLAELGVGGTRRVIRAAVSAGVPHLVHMSSVGAYSPKKDDSPVDESWPTRGVTSSTYSRHKAAAERLLDRLEAERSSPVVTRLRPGIVGQRSAGSALLRYGLTSLVPRSLLAHVPLLPLDRRLAIPMVHADDLAGAVVLALESRARGAFNVAAPPAVTAEDIARVLHARLVHVPAAAVRVAVSASWHARLQPLDAGWIDLAYAVPLMDTSRAVSELGWSPATTASEVLAETVLGMQSGAAGASEVLRERTVGGGLRKFLSDGPVSRRRRA
ncbi:NAD-dependent epimerase/dehydratase family protein [Nocardioides oleivorans]|uniref:NAD-dependent epimerase/dehydratase family protein n=1 Tax=Nocardioides oleivorans TaxID=273676 RepID=A0A4Q2RUX7_9ACTN|nr:NAD-dependent epimerase/dehydratase family protein [Nocardioides oleivorans]RYB91675.1 NAD-dependent epimerase/dehydratase family protein [Nocardioides oleivorans]